MIALIIVGFSAFGLGFFVNALLAAGKITDLEDRLRNIRLFKDSL